MKLGARTRKHAYMHWLKFTKRIAVKQRSNCLLACKLSDKVDRQDLNQNNYYRVFRSKKKS